MKLLGSRGARIGSTYLAMFFFLIVTLYPIFWLLSGSLKSETEFFSNVWGISADPQFSNYVNAWVRADFSTKYLNSVITTFSFLCILIPVNCCAGYALARVNFRGRKFIYLLLLLGIMMPAGVLAMPTFNVVHEMGLLNTRSGLVLVYVAQAISFGMFLMRSFFISLPGSLEEAATIDGCSRFQAFRKVMLPLAIPGITTQIIFSGLAVWNEYLRANLLIRSPELQTIPLGMASFANQDNVNYPEMFAALIMAIIPVILIYLLLQKTFVKGVTAGSVKG
ncbi:MULTISPECIES: carbohydrate ABC transporter permease [Cohnella]|uniref:Carbohydrate ABC transporter membrane protein 2 (CUT1 family) n=1 Tax=Cohnella phaseoli TaxID=456490 RepID=A0A3D9IU36_9BACL|nr:carbohydrate ABC transporter permease [Cohnella phaseoli]RED65270.1 carbohydrate ABC transporter membrane protein 2 (CUT1 family) [Cohnella phaseoli]